MKEMPDHSIDSIITDPPYELGFMGKKWDASGIAFNVEVWKEALRVLKPGGHLLAFSGSRTYHRMAVAIEDAGFEIRDQIMWIYGSGFPKSHNLKDEWQGWGTALKPAHEPIVLARKPLIGTVVSNVLKYGTGGINIDGTRIGNEERTYKGMSANRPDVGTFRDDNWVPKNIEITVTGRFPANIIHDESDEIVQYFGEAHRFFYGSKINKKDRNEGLNENTNHHPTVKPTDLMGYLCRLVTPPNGTVLDPFMGSGSTGKACMYEEFNFIGIDMTEEYVNIAKERIEFAKNESKSKEEATLF